MGADQNYTSDNRHYENVDGKVTDITDQIPFDVPTGWSWTRLENICTHNAGKTLDKSKNKEGVSLEYITTSNLYWGHFILSDLRTMSFKNEEIDKCTALKGDLLICEGGDAGRSAIWRYDYPIRFQNHIHRVRLLGAIQAEYILFCLERFVKGGSAEKHKKGIGIQNISGTSLGQILIPLPPLSEQCRIHKAFEFLITQTERIDCEQAELTNLVVLAKSKILDLAMRGKLVPQDPNDEPASELLARLSTSHKSHYENVPFEVPRNWTWIMFGEICDYGSSETATASQIAEDAWCLDLEDIEKGTAKILNFVKKDERPFTSTKHSFKKGQLLYSKLRPYLNKVIIAPKDGYCTSEILPLTFDVPVCERYVRHVLRSTYFLAYANRCSRGIKMPRLGTTDGKKALLPLPPLAEQKRIVAAIEDAFTTIDTITT